MGFRPLSSCKPPSLMSQKNHSHNLVRHHGPHFYHYGRRASPSDHHHRTFHSDSQQKKTQCQLCKRLTWPIIPHSWSSMVWKRVSPWIWSLRRSQNPWWNGGLNIFAESFLWGRESRALARLWLRLLRAETGFNVSTSSQEPLLSLSVWLASQNRPS